MRQLLLASKVPMRRACCRRRQVCMAVTILITCSVFLYKVNRSMIQSNWINNSSSGEVYIVCARYNTREREYVDSIHKPTISIRPGLTGSYERIQHKSFINLMRDSLRFKPTAVTDEIEVTKISIENRRQRVSDMCSSQGASYYSGNYSDTDFFHHIYMNEKHKFLYCAIEKVGCTFWKRLLYFLSGEKNLSSPYDLSMSRAHTVPLLNVDKLSKPAYHHVMNTYTKIIFVRDPYKRLFSGYVDKIFSRYDAWSSYSKIIIQLARKNRTYLSNACGNDVTFAEFVTFYTYSMNKKLYMNGHFVPMYVHSRPCDVKYDFIGKLETFKNDVAFIFKKLGLEDIIPLLSAQKSVAATDEFYDATSIIFGAKNKKANCFDFYDFVVRTWRKLQIKGLISTKIPLPFSRREMDSVNKDLFFKTLLKSHEISLRDLDLKNNRANAIKEAFQSVSSDSMEKLKAILHPDCKLFGYDLEPKYLFQPSKTKPNSFRYFDFNRDINVLNKML